MSELYHHCNGATIPNVAQRIRQGERKGCGLFRREVTEDWRLVRHSGTRQTVIRPSPSDSISSKSAPATRSEACEDTKPLHFQ